MLGNTFDNMKKITAKATIKDISSCNDQSSVCEAMITKTNTNRSINQHQNVSVTRESLQLFGEGGHNDVVLNDVRHLVLQILLIKCNQGIWTSIPNLKRRTKLLLWLTTLSLCDHSGAIYGFPKEHVLHWTWTHQSCLTERRVSSDTLTKHQPPTAFEVARLTL